MKVMNCDISVIIPTFNVENYIEDALQSIIEQEFNGSIEIIVIDDCSTDRTVRIVEKFIEEKHTSDIKLFRFEKNMKQGTARNYGINNASGKYIFFLDGDDFLDNNAFQMMFLKAEESHCDFVVCDWIYYYEDKGLVYVNNDLFMLKEELLGEECEELYRAPVYFTVNKLYRKEFLLNNQIYYGEGYIYEDYEFYTLTAQFATKVSIVPNPFYRVRVNSNSTTKTNKKSTLHIDSLIMAISNLLKNFNPRNEYSYYHVYEYIIRKSLHYSRFRAPYGYKRKTLKKILDLLNSKSTIYNIPSNLKAKNYYYFRKKLVQKKKINLILLIDLISSKKTTLKISKYIFDVWTRIKETKYYKKYKNYQKKIKIDKMYKKPLRDNLIVFLGFDYKYIGNSKYLFEYLINSKTNYQIKFITKDLNVADDYRILPRSNQFYEVLSQAKLVVAESWVPLDIRKRENTIWIQLWHGTPFKRLLFDSNEFYISKFNRNHKKQKQSDIRKWDYLLSDSIDSINKFSSAFAFDKEKILDYGYPRVEWLKQNKGKHLIKEQIKQKLNISLEKKVVLYVPTWRDYNYKQKNADFSYLLDLDRLSSGLGENFTILYKPHGMEKTKLKSQSIINLNEDIETQELILISDIIVSDYSSIIFDAVAIDIPFLLYINDFEKYEKARGVYNDMHRLLSPFYFDDIDLLINEIQFRLGDKPREGYQLIKELYSNVYKENSCKMLSLKINELMESSK